VDFSLYKTLTTELQLLKFPYQIPCIPIIDNITHNILIQAKYCMFSNTYFTNSAIYKMQLLTEMRDHSNLQISEVIDP